MSPENQWLEDVFPTEIVFFEKWLENEDFLERMQLVSGGWLIRSFDEVDFGAFRIPRAPNHQLRAYSPGMNIKPQSFTW